MTPEHKAKSTPAVAPKQTKRMSCSYQNADSRTPCPEILIIMGSVIIITGVFIFVVINQVTVVELMKVVSTL